MITTRSKVFQFSKWKSRKTYSTMSSEESHGRLNLMAKAFRTYGHFESTIDPLGILKPEIRRELHPGLYGFKIISGDSYFDCDGIIQLGAKNPKRYATMMEILEHLRGVYCQNVGAIFSHLETKEQNWIARELESSVLPPGSQPAPNDKEALSHYLNLITESEIFDQFLAKKFPLVKRYGLEGSEGLMILLDGILKEFGNQKLSNLIIGMPHRGRLNIMSCLFGRKPRTIFHKMRGNSELPLEWGLSGDVLSHLGITTQLSNGITVSLLNNPSHLEAINPVALGKTRSKISCFGKNAGCLLIHGDSSFTGQGIVSESFSLANLPHFTVRGTVHVVLNNQLGFTLTKDNARSSRYSADLGKMIDAPIFVVHGEKPDDLARISKLIVNYREKFKKDVIVEIVAYRRHGHNELDEPAFTQPFMYQIIRARPSFISLYEKQLLENHVIGMEEVAAFKKEQNDYLDSEFKAASESSIDVEEKFFVGNWKDMKHPEDLSNINGVSTGYDESLLKEIGLASVALPKGFAVHSKLLKAHIEPRVESLQEGNHLDWPSCEALALGSLVKDGFNIRFCGQDVARGTFSQRHLVLVDQNTGEELNTLRANIKDRKGDIEIVPSPLSELAVLGFEYGFSIDSPNNLAVWEAQFGDFTFNAQTILDQFIANGESKWNLMSSIVLLLPHGMDGNGSEHSSAKIERFLQLCDGCINEDSMVQKNVNMFVVNCTTAANFFHVLRRQMAGTFRKPLIVISPKTLLKSQKPMSSLKEMGPGTSFKPVLPDNGFKGNSETLEHVMFCTGKIYYDLDDERVRRKLEKKINIIRLEELSPFPFQALEKELQRLGVAKKSIRFSWIQEEHENQGAYVYTLPRIQRVLKHMGQQTQAVDYIGRRPLSSSAVGIALLHKKEVQKLMTDAFSMFSDSNNSSSASDN